MRPVLFVALLTALSYAQQTVTTVDQNGQSVVEVVSTNNGVATTQVISTVQAADHEQGPVGQPGQQITGTGPTPYTYTTLIDGVYTAVVDTFTPTFPATQSPSIGPSGTKWDYDDWSKIYATQTGNSATSRRPPPLATTSGLLINLLAGFLAGVWVVRRP